MKKKTKKVALGIGIAVLLLGAGGATVAILQHQGKAPLDYVQTVKVENMWKFAQNDVTAELRDHVTVAKDGKITVSEDLDAPAAIISEKKIVTGKKTNLYVSADASAEVTEFDYDGASILPLTDGNGNGFINLEDLDDFTDKKGNLKYRAGIVYNVQNKAEDDNRLTLTLVPGGVYSALGVYDLSPLGFADDEKCNYIFEKLTEGKAFGDDFIFNKGNVSKFAREYDDKMAEEAKKSSQAPASASASN